MSKSSPGATSSMACNCGCWVEAPSCFCLFLQVLCSKGKAKSQASSSHSQWASGLLLGGRALHCFTFDQKIGRNPDFCQCGIVCSPWANGNKYQNDTVIITRLAVPKFLTRTWNVGFVIGTCVFTLCSQPSWSRITRSSQTDLSRKGILNCQCMLWASNTIASFDSRNAGFS